ncbi:MAG: hypothetical protein H7A37_06905 [Chlamydiales bacterium]|nr:hypothetical protein [Chlamydiales bacterium]
MPIVQFDSTVKAQQAIIDFYHTNQNDIGRTFTAQVGNEDPITAEIKKQFSTFFTDDHRLSFCNGLCLTTSNNNVEATQHFADGLVAKNIPVFDILFGSQNATFSQQYIPPSYRRTIRVQTAAPSATFNDNAHRSDTHSQTSSHFCGDSHASTNQQKKIDEPVALSNEIFTKRYRHESPSKISATNCTFNKGILAKQDIYLNHSEAKKDSISSQHGSIVCENSTLKEIDAQGRGELGDISIINCTVGLIDAREGNVTCDSSSAQSIRAKKDVTCTRSSAITIISSGNITLFDSNAGDVTAKEGRITWTNDKQNECATGEIKAGKGNVLLRNVITEKPVQAMGKVELNHSIISTLTVNVPKAPIICIHLKENAVINGDLIIKEMPETIRSEKMGSRITKGGMTQLPTNEYIGTFSCPDKTVLQTMGKTKINGVVLNEAGRIEGIAYQFYNGQYIPGVRIFIVGEGSIKGKIIYENCSPINDGLYLGPNVNINN